MRIVFFGKSKPEYTDAELLEGIRQQADWAFNDLYSRFLPQVQQYVLANQGSEEDAHDLFQDALIALWDNVREGRYELRESARLGTYLVRLCQYRWLDRLKSSRHRYTQAMPDFFEAQDESHFLDSLLQPDELRRLEALFGRLGQKCQEILSLFYYEEQSMEKIAAHFEMTAASAKNEKYRCMEKLKSFARE